eukprot:TRINITY_DN13586_c0_g1_i1.p1 TRINITY_DN13586_c0_g1~~TRINITY_DN13586_c0_g1_i1.p1  ORF type:complete len:140 (-),score=18.50 TRINITY_DN13586_c0_g1_i1:10-429(-)
MYSKTLWQKHTIEIFEHMIRTKPWWDTVDLIASKCVGSHLVKYPKHVATMDEWIHDECLWIRRTSLIFQLSYKKKTDETRLYKYISTVMHEKEFFIQKAIGWSLRQYSKTNPSSVSKFIKQNSSNLARLSIREGSKYLD